MHLSCTNGRTAADGEAAVNNIWRGFSPVRADQGLSRKPLDGFNHADGCRMTFWGPENESGIATQNAASLREMLRVTQEVHATCVAWAVLLHHVFGVHGVAAWILRAQSAYGNDDGRPLPGGHARANRAGFLVKEWTFAAEGTSGRHCADFTHRFGEDVAPSTPTPGQGNETPPSRFLEHYLTLANAQVFDPSYGKGPFAATQDQTRRILTAWEEEALSGYVKRCAGDQFVAKRDTPGNQEMEYTAVAPR
jgi:hypothetical protein